MRNLMALLMACGPEELGRIAEWWSVELPPSGKQAERAAVLGREMLRDSSAHRFWDRLPQGARALFMAFADEPEQRLSALRLGRDDPALLACLESGTLWAFEEGERAGGLPSLTLPPVPDPTLVLPPELQRLAHRLRSELEAGDTSGQPLHESLARLGTGELENLAAYWGLAAEPGSLTRDELLESLLGRISGASTEQVLREAPPAARALYGELLRSGGQAPTRELGERLGLGGPELRDAVADLGERLLALEAYAEGGWRLYAPEGPVHALPGEERGGPPAPVPAPDRHVTAPLWAPAWDLINLLRALELYDVPVEGDGELPEAFVSRFETALATRPSDPAANLRHLHGVARSLGLVEARDGAFKPLGRARAFAEGGLEQQSRRLLERWLERGSADEDAPLRGAAGYRADAETLRAAREGVLEQLARCEPGVWYPAEGLLELVRARNPFLLRPQNRLVRDLGSSGARRALESWREREGRWVEGVLRGALGWLHVVETEEEPEPLFCLTPDGAWLAGRVSRPPVATSRPRLSVSEEGRIRVAAPDGRLVWALAGFARPVRTGGRPAYVIDRRSVARARGAGIPASSILAFLRKHAENGVPPELARLVQEWGREPHRIKMRGALLVECETEAGAEELMASPIARPHSPRRVDPLTVLLCLPGENVDEELKTLVRRLTRSGLFSAGGVGRGS